MDPVMIVLVPGLIGGVVLALIIFRIQAPRTRVDPLRNFPIATDIINMARIRVDGVGGLGLVAMALTVAWFVLKIRVHIAIGLGLGILFAIVLIALRRRHGGPMPSSGESPGANITLGLDAPPSPADLASPDVPGARIRDAA